MKHLSTPRKRNYRDSLSSGERKGKSPNPDVSVDLGPTSSGSCKTQETGPKTCNRVTKLFLSGRSLERATIESDSLVREKEKPLLVFLSTTGHEESCGKLG